jgi:hypothetical protein
MPHSQLTYLWSRIKIFAGKYKGLKAVCRYKHKIRIILKNLEEAGIEDAD